MSDRVPGAPAARAALDDAEFERLAGWSAIAAGVAGAIYALAFVVLRQDLLAGLALLLAPLLTTPALIAVYLRVRVAGPGLALWALALAIGGSLGAVAHGGFNLAKAVNPPPVAIDLPFPADPRGLFTFGLTGIALLGFAWLARRTAGFPRWVAPLGSVLALVLVLTYLGRLIVLDAASPFVLGPALVAGVLSPAFYLGLGWWFLRAPESASAAGLR